ncbi:MerR family transcriptional regulator [Streptomyces sp. SID3915]|uniref:MerR family transcriptional regulator n=1 Tax=Streptomyces sp. SID3915 TaxID=2690263 RepID=UPI00136A556F|nr:MerR family transcriptional regulator [Streptomyces sp. SID3915]MYX73021.1 MerR family transcriptional regulator [Streptomyces sp. SID3915]
MTMRISQLAERSGVPATTLRFDENVGLLPADRTSGGHRSYSEDAVERLAFIGAAKLLGLPLEEIGELLGIGESGACHEVKADLRPRIAGRLGEAERRAAELTAFTDCLHSASEHPDALPDRAGRCDPECGFLGRPVRTVARPVDVAVAPSRRTAAAEPESWRTAPVACSLTGGAYSERADLWHQVLEGAERRAVDDGIRLTLPADRAGAVAELAADEQQCCRFFDFRLHLDGHRLRLEVRAPADAAALLTELFGTAS